MIKITFYTNGFIATGHAYSNEFGRDLVCAGVSAIIMGALNWFNHSTTKINVDDETIKVVGNHKEISHLLDLLFVQLSALAHGQNAKYIAIEKLTKLYE